MSTYDFSLAFEFSEVLTFCRIFKTYNLFLILLLHIRHCLHYHDLRMPTNTPCSLHRLTEQLLIIKR